MIQLRKASGIFSRLNFKEKEHHFSGIKSLIGRGCRTANGCPEYDSKPSDDEAPVLELWGMWSTHSWQLLSNPYWPKSESTC